ncbi:MAG: Hsp70 family protein [Lachnospiraceae bacterium]|nr:Hsp70 family protein [Lachnospiraceae bacterium]
MTIGIDITKGAIQGAFISKDGNVNVITDNKENSFLSDKLVFESSTNNYLVGNSIDVDNMDYILIKNVFSALGTRKIYYLGDKKLYPQVVFGIILKAFIRRIEENYDVKIDSVVFSVPVLFDSTGRVALIQAAQIAGLQTKRIINQSSALLMFLSSYMGASDNIFLMTYDKYELYGGIFDIDDNVIYPGFVHSDFPDKYSEISNSKDNIIINFSLDIIRKSKIKTTVLKELFFVLDDTLYDEIPDIDDKIKDKLVLKTKLNNIRVIRYGSISAIGAALLALRFDDMDMALKICPRVVNECLFKSVSIALKSNETKEIFPENISIPCYKTHLFLPSGILQSEAYTSVVLGNSNMVYENKFIGYLELNRLKKSFYKKEKILVTFRIDKNGIMDVRAERKDSNKKVYAFITTESFMDGQEILEATRLIKQLIDNDCLTLCF